MKVPASNVYAGRHNALLTLHFNHDFSITKKFKVIIKEQIGPYFGGYRPKSSDTKTLLPDWYVAHGKKFIYSLPPLRNPTGSKDEIESYAYTMSGCKCIELNLSSGEISMELDESYSETYDYVYISLSDGSITNLYMINVHIKPKKVDEPKNEKPQGYVIKMDSPKYNQFVSEREKWMQ